jgi:RimJ/RimL family protein N-acetyltransferase
VDEALQHLAEEPLLAGHRLDLEPVQVEHAEEMGPLLDDVRLHTFTGGRPATVPELRERYRRLAARRSPDGSQRWLNWVARRREDGQAVGTVQATVTRHGHGLTAEVAWVVAPPHQRRGYAREAAGTMVAWLRDQGVARIVAHVDPRHEASQGVARAVGLAATGTVVDGEVRWQG